MMRFMEKYGVTILIYQILISVQAIIYSCTGKTTTYSALGWIFLGVMMSVLEIGVNLDNYFKDSEEA